ncbi:MAG: lipocalin-like domain-containing protein [Desulfobacterales bacterium]
MKSKMKLATAFNLKSRRRPCCGVRAAVVGCLLLALSSTATQAEGFRQIAPPCQLEFPAAHGAHPGFQTEWWYYTGNLQSDAGRLFGFQFTLFRRQLRPDTAPGSVPAGTRSAWRTHQVYLGHAAVADIAQARHLQAESLSRGMDLLAGVFQQGETTRLRLQRWEGIITPEAHRLRAAGDEFAYRLRLTPKKPPVLHGDRGYSRKGSTPQRASCYYSLTRLAVSGEIELGGQTFPVQGLAWMDHEFSSAYLEPGLAGWDWFSMQLSDGTEVMIFLLRRTAGGLSPASSGTFVARDGTARHLRHTDFSLTPGKIWRSPRSGGRYPIDWTIRLPDQGLELRARAAFADQELETRATTGITYWEGSMEISGTRRGRPIQGRGYLEMTGRAGQGFEAPL